jgi:hypothetical protein
MTGRFEQFFRSSSPARDRYLSRLFGLFSEDVVRAWCACPEASYDDVGRPTLCIHGESRGHTIDFTLRHRESSRTYVAEMKCELEYNGYRYLRLTSADQIQHHTSVEFGKFLAAARNPRALVIRCKGIPIEVDGAILVWGTIAPEGRIAAMNKYGLADVLSVEQMILDLQNWAPDRWTEFVDPFRRWTIELFDFLTTNRSSA